MLVLLPDEEFDVSDAMPIDGTPAGEAFLSRSPVEERQPDDVRVYLPLLDGSDELGVLALNLDRPEGIDDGDRRLLLQLASLVADVLVTKGNYTDRYFQARRRGQPMSMAAEIQYSLLPHCRWTPRKCRSPECWSPPTGWRVTAWTTPSTTTSCTSPSSMRWATD